MTYVNINLPLQGFLLQSGRAHTVYGRSKIFLVQSVISFEIGAQEKITPDTLYGRWGTPGYNFDDRERQTDNNI